MSPSSIQMSHDMPITNIAEMKIMRYAERRINKSSMNSVDPSVLDKLEFTGMQSVTACTKFSVQDAAFSGKLKDELLSANCPDKIIAAICDNIACVEQEMAVKSDCKVDGGEGYWFKIAYCLHKEDGKTKFAMTIFGASFKANLFERYEETHKPVLEDVTRTVKKGYLWWKREETIHEQKQVGEEVIKTPVFKGVTNKDLDACMDLLELKACEKVLEAGGCEAQPVRNLALTGRSNNEDANACLVPSARILTLGGAVLGVMALLTLKSPLRLIFNNNFSFGVQNVKDVPPSWSAAYISRMSGY